MPDLLHQRGIRAAAWLLIVLVSIGSSDLFHSTRTVDPCDSLPLSHDASQHRLGGVRSDPTQEPEHCYLCHWARTFGSLEVSSQRVITSETVSRPFRLIDPLPPSYLASSRLPARSPPSDPL